MTDNNDDYFETLTKRDFLQSIGMIGGSAAVMTALRGWEISSAATMEKPTNINC